MLQVLHHGETVSVPWGLVEIIRYIREKNCLCQSEELRNTYIKYVLCSFYKDNCRPETTLNELSGPLLLIELKVEVSSPQAYRLHQILRICLLNAYLNA